MHSTCPWHKHLPANTNSIPCRNNHLGVWAGPEENHIAHTTHWTREDTQGRMLQGPPDASPPSCPLGRVCPLPFLSPILFLFLHHQSQCMPPATNPANKSSDVNLSQHLYATLSPRNHKATSNFGKWSGFDLRTTTFKWTLRSNGASTLDTASLQRKYCCCERGSPGFFPLWLQTNLLAGQNTEV